MRADALVKTGLAVAGEDVETLVFHSLLAMITALGDTLLRTGNYGLAV